MRSSPTVCSTSTHLLRRSTRNASRTRTWPDLSVSMGDPAILPCNLMSAPMPPGTTRARWSPSPSNRPSTNTAGRRSGTRRAPRRAARDPSASSAVAGLVTDEPRSGRERGQLHRPARRGAAGAATARPCASPSVRRGSPSPARPGVSSQTGPRHPPPSPAAAPITRLVVSERLGVLRPTQSSASASRGPPARWRRLRWMAGRRDAAPRLFALPGIRGGHLGIENWRSRAWCPALEAAWDLEARPVPPTAHIRDRGARGRRLDVRVVAGDGHVDPDDRPALRAPREGLRGLDSGAARRRIHSNLASDARPTAIPSRPRSRMGARITAEAGDGARTHDPQLGKLIRAPRRSATIDVERPHPCGFPGILGSGGRMVT